MPLQLVADDNLVLHVKIDGKVHIEPFDPAREPIAEMFGSDVYQRRLILCLAEVQYLNSSGIGWLLCCHKRFRQAGGRLVVHSLPRMADQVLRLMQLEKVLHVSADADAARRTALEPQP